MIRFVKKKKAGYYSLMMAIVGIVLMILENELTGAHIYDKASMYVHICSVLYFHIFLLYCVNCSSYCFKASIYSIAVKLMISVSTIMLLGLIIAYHIFSVQVRKSMHSLCNFVKFKYLIIWKSRNDFLGFPHHSSSCQHGECRIGNWL